MLPSYSPKHGLEGPVEVVIFPQKLPSQSLLLPSVGILPVPVLSAELMTSCLCSPLAQSLCVIQYIFLNMTALNPLCVSKIHLKARNAIPA